MSAFSRNKGARGERLAAAEIKRVTGVDVERAARNGVDGSTDVVGLPGFAIEVKFGYKTQQPNLWWKQAVKNAKPGEHPLLMYKPPRKPWIFRLPFGIFFAPPLKHLWIETNSEGFGNIYKIITRVMT
jgi:hypothetical protein